MGKQASKLTEQFYKTHSTGLRALQEKKGSL
jgi:hypothetical protein